MSEYLPRTSPLGGCSDADLTVLSWNVLAPAWADPERYIHVAGDALAWSHRLPQILREIERTAATVVCLQEVGFDSYSDELCPALEALGYAGAVQTDRKRGPEHPAGTATFWQTSKLRLAGSALTRSRTLTTVLADQAGRHVAVVNCHLEGDPSQSVARVKQLQSSLQQLATLEHQAVVVCGDFNCDLRSSAAAAYLAFGTVLQGVCEWGREVPAAACAVPPHGYALTSAYSSDRAGEFSFTIRGMLGSVWFLDQLWFSGSALQLLAARSPFASAEHRQTILETGLPSASEPSDHLPIGAAFRWAPEAPDLRPSSSSATTPAPVEADPAAEAAELLAACPITEAQREEWLISTALPELPKGQKPSAEQLAELKELQRRKEALLASVGEEARAMLVRSQQLVRKARKR